MLITIIKGVQEYFLLAALCAFGQSQPSPEVENIRGDGVTRAGLFIILPFY